MCVRACVRVCALACVCVRAHVCARVCVRVCVRLRECEVHLVRCCRSLSKALITSYNKPLCGKCLKFESDVKVSVAEFISCFELVRVPAGELKLL